MEKPLDLALLYTCNLRGDLQRLPRLYTFLRRLRGANEAGVQTLLLDLGASCDPAVWPCGVTGGRSTLIVLDGMGYDAANVEGVLAADARQKVEVMLTVALVDETHSCEDDGVLMTVDESTMGDVDLHIVLAPAPETRLDGRTLYLADVEGGQVGTARVHLPEAGAPQLVAHAVQALPPDTPPDPTIVASVDFVESEARYYERRKP